MLGDELWMFGVVSALEPVFILGVAWPCSPLSVWKDNVLTAGLASGVPHSGEHVSTNSVNDIPVVEEAGFGVLGSIVVDVFVSLKLHVVTGASVGIFDGWVGAERGIETRVPLEKDTIGQIEKINICSIEAVLSPLNVLILQVLLW